MAEEEIITTAPVADNPTLSFGNKTVDKYYQTILKTLKPETIEQQIIRTPTQTREEINQGVQSYLRPQLRQGLTDLREATRGNIAELDADAASRGMGGSTWLTDAKNRQYKAENQQRASMYNNYNAALAQQVEGQYANYLERLRAVDTQNAANKIEVDEWNAQVKTAMEKLAYERALTAMQLANSAIGGGRRGSSGHVPTAEELAIEAANARLGQYLLYTGKSGDETYRPTAQYGGSYTAGVGVTGGYSSQSAYNTAKNNAIQTVASMQTASRTTGRNSLTANSGVNKTYSTKSTR